MLYRLLNVTQLQFDVAGFSFCCPRFSLQRKLCRREPATIEIGFGDGTWIIDGAGHLAIAEDEHDGWIVCEWYHDVNAPQLFQTIRPYDQEPLIIPFSCSTAVLELAYI
jgi:hypothetical protein